MQPVTLHRALGDQHHFIVADREAFTAVRANYHDVKLAQRAFVQIGEEEEIDGRDVETTTQPSASNVKTLRHTYANKANAARAARVELDRISAGWRRSRSPWQKAAPTFPRTARFGQGVETRNRQPGMADHPSNAPD